MTVGIFLSCPWILGVGCLDWQLGRLLIARLSRSSGRLDGRRKPETSVGERTERLLSIALRRLSNGVFTIREVRPSEWTTIGPESLIGQTRKRLAGAMAAMSWRCDAASEKYVCALDG